jgi:hypothetical protein
VASDIILQGDANAARAERHGHRSQQPNLLSSDCIDQTLVRDIALSKNA